MNKFAKTAIVLSIVAGAIPPAIAQTVSDDALILPFPDLETSVNEYVDPTVARRSSCEGHPGRPGWVMVHEQGYEWRAELAMLWKQREAGVLISEAQTCTCDMIYPDFDQRRVEIEALWDTVGVLPRQEWTADMGNAFYDVREEIASEARSYARLIGQLCANPE